MATGSFDDCQTRQGDGLFHRVTNIYLCGARSKGGGIEAPPVEEVLKPVHDAFDESEMSEDDLSAGRVFCISAPTVGSKFERFSSCYTAPTAGVATLVAMSERGLAPPSWKPL